MKKDIFDRIMFGADDPGAGGAPAPVAPPADPKPEDLPSKLTNKEVNDLIQANKQEAVVNLLKEIGVESTGKLKEDLKTLKAWQDSQKTEGQKLTDDLKAEKAGRETAEQRANIAEAIVDAIDAGVDPKKAKKAIKVISEYEGETTAAKTEAFLKEFPEFKASTAPVIPNSGRVKGGQDPTLDALKANVGKAFGLKSSL